jgi:hypothetical protein
VRARGNPLLKSLGKKRELTIQMASRSLRLGRVWSGLKSTRDDTEKARGESGEGAEALAEAVGVAVAEEAFNLLAGAFPEGDGAGEEGFAPGREVEQAAAAVGGIGGDFEQATALERFEGGGEGGAIHAEEIGHRGHTGRVGAIEGHEQRKLPIGELGGTKCVVEAAS